MRHAVDETRRSYPTVTIVDQVPAQLTAFADGGRLGGVVHELLDNACRYSPSGGTVELVARVLDEGVVVTVTDRGEGLDRAMLTQAFDQPFSTGEETLRKERSGIGVGLHLAHQVVVEHGGSCGPTRCPAAARACRSASPPAKGPAWPPRRSGRREPWPGPGDPRVGSHLRPTVARRARPTYPPIGRT